MTTTFESNSRTGHRLSRRTAWFSAGLAVALVAGGSITGLSAGAADPSRESAFVPIVPCRLMDTRPGEQVGTRGTPVGAAEAHLQQVTGMVGNCDIPSSASAVAMNVTTVAPTQASFLTIYPDGNALPKASNLNYVAGQAPTPNKVDVALSASGALRFYNNVGSVHVVADIVGYYKPNGVAELTTIVNGKADKTAVYTKAQVDGLIATVADAVDAVDVLLDTKPDIGDVYTQAAVDTLLADKASVTDLAGKADVTDLEALDLTVADHTGDIADLNLTLAGKAAQADLEALDLTVADHTGDLADLNLALDGKANAADVYTKAEVDTALGAKANAGDVYNKGAAEDLFMGRDPDMVMRQGTGEARDGVNGIPLNFDPLGLGVTIDPTLGAILPLIGPAAIIDAFKGRTDYKLGAVVVCFDDPNPALVSLIDTLEVRVYDDVTGIVTTVIGTNLVEGCTTIDTSLVGDGDTYTLGIDANVLGGPLVLTDVQTKWVPVTVVAP